eukprot:gene5190-6315_t
MVEAVTNAERDVICQLSAILSEDRHVLNYTNYTVSKEHRARVKGFPDSLRIHRSKWFTHPNWAGRMQMPPYHIHYREEMQAVLAQLKDSLDAPSPEKQQQLLRRAFQYFERSMQGLAGHVNIEEHTVFPKYQRAFPNVDISFLYKDHEHLHEEEGKLRREFERAKLDDGRQGVLRVVQAALAFDAALNTHLGEEEEIVVPITLAGDLR